MRISQVSTTLNNNPKILATGITYLPFGGITGLTYGNGLFLTQGYDNQYRISSVVTGSLLNLTLGYDPNGNITSILDVVNPPGGEVLETPGVYSYQQGTNKLAHIEGTPPIDYGYDQNGNITTENTWTYVYDVSNQLIRVQDNGVTVAEYVYNGMGQRIKKNAQGSVRVFHYNHLGYLISETTETGQTLVEYIYIGSNLLAKIQGEQVYYYHNDHLGTPQVLTNDSQAIAWKAVYTPFGEAVPSIQTVENPFRFPGQYYDSETGLHYNYFRYYNPQTGRYITPDPIGLEGGINLFAYVLNNPVNFTDPWGLDAIYIVYVGYPINTGYHDIHLPLGHAAVIAVNPQTGYTRYYEYGRYGGDFGRVLRQPVPDLRMEIGPDCKPTGRPTQESLKKLCDLISKEYGKGYPVLASYYSDADYQKVVDYAEGIKNDPNRKRYAVPSNTCYTFALKAIQAGINK